MGEGNEGGLEDPRPDAAGVDDVREAPQPTTARRPGWVLLALAVLLVGGLSFGIGRFTAFEPGPNAADVGFARDMQVHHAQAVEMAMIAYRSTQDEDVRLLSYDIATAQQQQAGQLFGWIQDWGLPQRGPEPLMQWMTEDGGGGHDHGGAAEGAAPATADGSATEEELRVAMGMATDAELAALRAATGTAQDCLFAGLMLRHHEGAIEMIDAIQRLGSDPQVARASAGMAESQQREIEALRALQTRLACGE